MTAHAVRETKAAPPRRRRRRAGRGTSRLVTLILLLAGALFVLLPLLWLLSTAFKRPDDAFAIPPRYTSSPTLVNFRTLFSGTFGHALMHSAIVAIASTVVALALGIPAGYAFSRSKIKFGTAINVWFVLAYVTPPMVFIIPIYIIYQHLHLLDTYTGLVLAYETGLLPFTVWLMRVYFEDVPRSLDEAAWIDGASKIRTLWSVVLPTVRPAIATVGLLVGLSAWGEYFGAVILTGPNTETAPVDIASNIGTLSNDWGKLAAAGLIVVVPALFATVAVQRGFVRGLTGGAVKQ
jgi:multiple sugar transport system permease protein